MNSVSNFIFYTLPDMFLTVTVYLVDFVTFMFTNFEFNIGNNVLNFSPIEIVFGAGVAILAAFIILKFLL